MGGQGEEGGEGVGGGFQYVARKGKANRKRRKGRDDRGEEGAREASENKLMKRREIIASKEALLVNGEIGQQIDTLLDRVFSTEGIGLPTLILALGLGSVKDSKAAQLQLAFLLCIRKKLEGVVGLEMQAYDPIFDNEDRELLESFKISCLHENVQGRYNFKKPVFVYMPHCTKTLYENILRANWSRQGLSQLWLCCNDLERYVSHKSIKSTHPCVERLVPRLAVHHLPTLPSPHNDGLNDLAIQLFVEEKDPVDSLTNHLNEISFQPNKPASEYDFWTLPPESTTSASERDPELI